MGQARGRKIEKRWKIKADHEAKKGGRVFSGAEHRHLHHALVTQTQLFKNLIRQEKYQCLLSPEAQEETCNALLKGQRLVRLGTLFSLFLPL